MSIKGKNRVICTDLSGCHVERVANVDFYRRYKDFVNIFASRIPEVDFNACFAQPEYKEESKSLEWYLPDAGGDWTLLTSQSSPEVSREKDRILDSIRAAYSQYGDVEKNMLDVILGPLSDPTIESASIYCREGRVAFFFWGVRNKKGTTLKDVIVDDVRDHRTHKVSYSVKGQGTLSFNEKICRHNHTILAETDVPEVFPNAGYKFVRWEPDSPTGVKVTQPLSFVAVCEKEIEENIPEPEIPSPDEFPKKKYAVTFYEGEHGQLEGQTIYEIEEGNVIPSIPSVAPNEGYEFCGWDKTTNLPVENDMTITALYKKIEEEVVEEVKDKESWWKRLWHNRRGCLTSLLKFLLGLLLFVLLVLLLSWLLSQCRGPKPGPLPGPLPPTPPIVVDPVDTVREPITDRPIVADRINLLIDDSELTVDDVTRDFQQMYSEPEYKVIYADPHTKRLQINVPSDERERLCNELANEFVQHFPNRYHEETIFVFTEAMFNSSSYTPNDSRINECWYLDAIQAKDAWGYTMGSDSVVVAIVDNGFDLRHREFKDKIYKPYNVYSRDASIHECAVPHGTHVAGTAIAIADNQEGIAGIAAKCRFMPVQVADQNGNMFTTGIVDGILYAIYSGADVINVSLGAPAQPNLPLPIQQELIASFKGEERLWKKVFEIAAKANTVMVLAAGNENNLTQVDPMHRSTNAFIVSAVNQTHNPLYNKADFSNYGPMTTISAPGVDIISSVHKNDYMLMNGTSMAAPMVTGAVALLRSVNNQLTPMQIREILQSTAIPTEGDIAKLLQLGDAVRMAGATEPDTTTTPVLHSGDIELTLRWENYHDIDLSCIEPNGEIISFQQRTSSSGGMLEVDMNAGGRNSSTPLEHIYWPDNAAQHGLYKVGVHFFSSKQESLETPYELTIIKYKTDTTRYVGQLDRVGEKHVVTFTL